MTPLEMSMLARVRPFGDAQRILISGILPDPWYSNHGREIRGMSDEFIRRSDSNLWFQAHKLIRTEIIGGKQITAWTEKAHEYRARILAAGYTGSFLNDPPYDSFPELPRTTLPLSTRDEWAKSKYFASWIKYFDFK